MHKIYSAQLPAKFLIDLLKKAMQENRNVCVICENQDIVLEVSKKVWSARAFLPHAICDQDFIEHQRIFIGCDCGNPINADVVVGFLHKPSVKSIVIEQA